MISVSLVVSFGFVFLTPCFISICIFWHSRCIIVDYLDGSAAKYAA